MTLGNRRIVLDPYSGMDVMVSLMALAAMEATVALTGRDPMRVLGTRMWAIGDAMHRGCFPLRFFATHEDGGHYIARVEYAIGGAP